MLLILNILGFIGDIALVLVSSLIGSFAPVKFKQQIKDITNNILAIEDQPKPENKCYAVQVINFPQDKDTDKTPLSAYPSNHKSSYRD